MTSTVPDTQLPAVESLVVAFSADPVLRWVYPESARYIEHFPELVRTVAGRAFEAETAQVADSHVGTALWLRPDAVLDEEALSDLVTRSVATERHEQVFAFLEQMGLQHLREPHWYLPFIGIDPAYQRRGLGSVLLARGLVRCDRDGLPAYLEASTPANRRLYERHGFEATGEIQAGSSPPMWPMVRRPR